MNTARLKAMLGINIRLCVHEIVSNRLRTVITTLGIFLGVASLLINLAFVRAMDNDVKTNMERIGGLDIVTIKKVDAVTPQEQLQFQRSPGLSIDDGYVLAREFPYVKTVVRSKDIQRSWVAAQGKQTGCRLKAVGIEYQKAYDTQIGKGRWFTEEDMARRTKVCIIGTRIQDRLFGNGGDAVGKQVTVREIPMTVIGVTQSRSPYSRQAFECLVPYPLYQEHYARAGRDESEIVLMLDSSIYARQAQEELSVRMFSLHRGIKDFEVEINIDKIKEMQTASVGMKAVLWSIAIISLLVGGISIMNIMFATIGDRIREIGIRKALGARNDDIFAQFIIEAVLVCLVGALPGMLVGAMITLTPPGVFPFEPMLTFSDYMIAVIFTLAAGFFSGLFPAVRASRLLPVEALRY